MIDESKCAVHSEKLEEVRLDIKSILKLLNGNGHIGICAMVSLMWTWGKVLVVTIIGVVARLIYVAIVD